MIEQACILAGGLGTRLGELTKRTPKPLLLVAGRPFLEYVLWNLQRHGIRRIVLSVGHLADQFQSVLGDGDRLGLDLSYIVEEMPLGTGGGLKLSADMLEKQFLVLNGDTICDINYLELALKLSDGNLAAMALRQVNDASRYGRVEMVSGRVVNFGEKSASGPGLISGGVYAFGKKALDYLPEGRSSIEQHMFPLMAAAGKLGGQTFSGFFLDIGLPETYNKAQKSLPEWQKRPAAFLGRDGVLNMDHGCVHEPSSFDWIQDAIEAVKLLNDSGYLVILITNQAGIGRGYYEEADFHRLTHWMRDRLAEVGAHIDGVYFCPHHPTEGKGPFKVKCQCRKPNPGMIEKALTEWAIDMGKSFMIGDKPKDMALAERVKIPGYLFPEGSLLKFVRPLVTS